MRSLLLLCASVSIAYSAPGETSAQIQQRFGAPAVDPADAGLGRPASAERLTTSMRETSRYYGFGKIEIIVYFFDNRSQREEYTGQFQQEDVTKIFKSASKGAPWTVELNEPVKDPAENERKKKTLTERGLTGHDHAYYKSNGLRAWVENSERGMRLIVEADAFRTFRISNPANKPEVAPPIRGAGKGF